jgi:hypothetical protein
MAKDQDVSVSPAEVEAPLLAHEQVTYACMVCGEVVGVGTPCERTDCPRVAAEQIRTAVADTPFQIGV